MSILKKTLLFFLLSLELVLLFFSTYLTIALIGITIPINSDYKPEEGDIEIFIISNGVHTDVCLPVKSKLINWAKYIDSSPFEGILLDPEYISIGWGDKGFFLDTPEWSDLTFSTAINATFLPSPTAMHVSYFDFTPKETESVRRCKITFEKYMELITFIKHSFLLNNNSLPVLIPNVGYTETDNFYEAKGNYHLFKTCNTWTNNALAIAGVKTSLLALFEKGILRHL